MLTPLHRTTKQRTGLTLLELIVVMAILVAIAAILIPLLPEFLGKGNQSAAATNMGELEKAIQTFRATYSRQPNHWDSMLTASGAALSGLVPSAGGAIERRTPTTGQASRLYREGILNVWDIYDTVAEGQAASPTEFHATLNPFVLSGSERTVVANGNGGGAGPVVMLTHPYTEIAKRGLVLNEDHDYALFGIGRYCNLCGPDGIVKEAPVYGQHSAENTPSTSYQRFAAVYDIGKPDTDTDRINARLVGVVALSTDRLFWCGDLVGTYGDNRYDASVPRK